MAVLLLALVLILWWFIYKKQNLKKKFLIFAFSFLIVIFFVALPVGVYFLQNPQDFISRAGPISVFSQENPAKALGLSLVEHLGMFNFYGDPNWRHNISGSPVLFWPVGILFLIGLIFSIYRIYKSIKIPSPERSRIFALFVFLTGWWLIMLLPAILSYEGIPHSLRSIGSLPPVFIFSGLGLGFLYQNIKERIKIKKGSVGFCLIIFSLILLAVSFLFGEFYRYFVTWGKSGEVENAFSKNYVETGNYLNSLPANIEKYVIINQAGVPVPWPDGLPMPAQTVMFVEQTKFREPQSTYLIPEKLDKIKKTEKETVISLLQYDENLINDLYLKFPQGKIQEENGRWLFKINF
jgi:hypothetical protein